MLSDSERDRLASLYHPEYHQGLTLKIHYTGGDPIYLVLYADGRFAAQFVRENDAYLFITFCAIAERFLPDYPLSSNDTPTPVRGRPRKT